MNKSQMIILTCWHTNQNATLKKHQIKLDVSQSLAAFDCSSCFKQVVSMVILGLPEEQTLARVVWSSATTMHGALCVLISGAILMLRWSVDN